MPWMAATLARAAAAVTTMSTRAMANMAGLWNTAIRYAHLGRHDMHRHTCGQLGNIMSRAMTAVHGNLNEYADPGPHADAGPAEPTNVSKPGDIDQPADVSKRAERLPTVGHPDHGTSTANDDPSSGGKRPDTGHLVTRRVAWADAARDGKLAVRHESARLHHPPGNKRRRAATHSWTRRTWTDAPSAIAMARARAERRHGRRDVDQTRINHAHNPTTAPAP